LCFSHEKKGKKEKEEKDARERRMPGRKHSLILGRALGRQKTPVDVKGEKRQCRF
jgi:hypothetical protein